MYVGRKLLAAIVCYIVMSRGDSSSSKFYCLFYSSLYSCDLCWGILICARDADADRTVACKSAILCTLLINNLPGI